MPGQSRALHAENIHMTYCFSGNDVQRCTYNIFFTGQSLSNWEAAPAPEVSQSIARSSSARRHSSGCRSAGTPRNNERAGCARQENLSWRGGRGHMRRVSRRGRNRHTSGSRSHLGHLALERWQPSRHHQYQLRRGCSNQSNIQAPCRPWAESLCQTTTSLQLPLTFGLLGIRRRVSSYS